MTTQWRAEALKYEDELLTDLKEMLAIKSVRDDEAATEDAPLGPGPKEALLKFEEFAKRDGFRTGNYKNLVAYAELGPEDAEETVAIIGHLDVMPAGDGWTKDPWSPVIEDGRLYTAKRFAYGKAKDNTAALVYTVDTSKASASVSQK